ncbi:MAG TPA: cytochrome P450 [Candidatus Entotheonella sp.]|jgi:cytochrome P450
MMTVMTYSPFAAEVKENPYPFYQWLREEQPVYYNEEFDFWALSRYAHVLKAARSPEIFSSAQGVGPDKAYGLSMITNDPPIHTRLRKLVNKSFTPRMIDAFASRIQTIVDELLDAAAQKHHFDLIDDYAIPLPVRVIAEILGVEPERRDDFKRWSDDVVHFVGGAAHGKDREQLRQSWEEFRDYFAATIGARRREPRDDIITVLVHASDGQDELTELEILNFCQLLLVGGNETTTNLIANAALALTHHPEQWQKLRQHPEFVPSMVEEVLRYDSPIQLIYRTTTREVEIDGTTIPADSKVALLWASANRDAAEFPEPDRFDVTRTPNRHLSFGSGIHYCLGAALARLEVRTTTATILRRMPYMRLAPNGETARMDNPLLRGLTRFPMVVKAV